jgi:transposase
MDADRGAVPDDIAALKEALAVERAKALEVVAELAVARAKASEDSALIAQQKLRIAKLERQIHGQRSERSSRLIEQLALTFEELESSATASLRPKKPSPGRQLCADLRARAPNAIRSPIIFPASAW